MRILMLDNEFPPLGGGTGVVNWHLLREWASDTDLHVDLITSSRTRDREETEAFADRVRIHKVPVHNLNIHHARNVELTRYFLRAWRCGRRLLAAGPYDLSLAFSTVPAGAVSLALARQCGLPYVVSLQGPDIPGFEARYNYLYPVLKPLIRLVWRHAAAVTAISEAHQQLALATMADVNIPIIPNGVDAQVFRPRAEGPRDANVRLVCVGRLIERKGQHYLLHAMASLWERGCHAWRLDLIGTGDAEPALRSLATTLGIEDRVRFVGFVGREAMPAVYGEADVFVLPSQCEGMSIALLEAVASGLPVIVTNTGGTKELVDGNGFIVPWADPAALADKLQSLVASPGLRDCMGRRSREIALGFTWQRFAERYSQCCKQAVERMGKRA